MWRRGPWFQLALILANGLLLAAIVHVWWSGEAAAPALKAGQEPALPKAPLLRDKRPLDEFRVIATKTLFNSSRTGPDLDLATAKGQGSLEGRQLLGTIIIGDEQPALRAFSTRARRNAEDRPAFPGAGLSAPAKRPAVEAGPFSSLRRAASKISRFRFW